MKFGDKAYHKNKLVLILKPSKVRPKSKMSQRDVTCDWYYYIDEYCNIGAAPETEFEEFPK